MMKRELGVARCGLACCMCSQNDTCKGCYADDCYGVSWCENRKCNLEKELHSCCDCTETCEKGMFSRVKLRAFRTFVQRYGSEKFMNCLEENEKKGILYHREGLIGDYDHFEDVEALIQFVLTGEK